jgi:hypothetical protein
MYIVKHVHDLCLLSRNLISTNLLKTKWWGLLCSVFSGNRWSLRSVTCDACCSDNTQKFKSLSIFSLGVCRVCHHMLIECVIRANKMREGFGTLFFPRTTQGEEQGTLPGNLGGGEIDPPQIIWRPEHAWCLWVSCTDQHWRSWAPYCWKLSITLLMVSLKHFEHIQIDLFR